ncbi:TFIIB-type zinc ribbon-containing protein [Fundidesulfovibrio putealis]|uniref:TFIIB-type zinc ribbon-containing protein n=1 Tax=Fundidesulfovibrio putealis TaxID=270496 RepID=UPI0009FC02AC|nr:zf-TFIIB domain-containing protein [Fundidesulfovibrio putealis]
MNCPHCNITLVMAERSGVEIDYCPQCRGVWLDKGELDKIIEKAAQTSSSQVVYDQPRAVAQEMFQDKYFHDHGDRGHREDKHGKHGKKKSWLGDILDF